MTDSTHQSHGSQQTSGLGHMITIHGKITRSPPLLQAIEGIMSYMTTTMQKASGQASSAWFGFVVCFGTSRSPGTAPALVYARRHLVSQQVKQAKRVATYETYHTATPPYPESSMSPASLTCSAPTHSRPDVTYRIITIPRRTKHVRYGNECVHAGACAYLTHSTS